MNQQQKQIQIKARDEDLKGVYSNLMIVRHTKEEFCLDFINTLDPPSLVSRVIISPSHAKRVIKALEENMKRYEDQFGIVKMAEQPKPDIGFKP